MWFVWLHGCFEERIWLLSCLRDVLEMRVDFGSSDAGVRGEDGRKKRRWTSRKYDFLSLTKKQRRQWDRSLSTCRNGKLPCMEGRAGVRVVSKGKQASTEQVFFEDQIS